MANVVFVQVASGTVSAGTHTLTYYWKAPPYSVWALYAETFPAANGPLSYTAEITRQWEDFTYTSTEYKRRLNFTVKIVTNNTADFAVNAARI
ncbi:MAG TPA: hypothetical protein VE692_03210, partial [Nitrososphaera sp.]|nr:hypothetical protein [Nitrososphaera sp.]